MGFHHQRKKDESGVALFMVVSAMMLLSVLVTEFTYVTQVNARIAADGMDQLKARYLAKNAFKLALLRLKAFQQVQTLAKQAGSAAPMRELQQIWSMPFAFPIPKQMLNLSIVQKDAIEKFEKSTSLDGNFTMIIQSDSDRFNLNSILPSFNPTASASPAASVTPGASASPLGAEQLRIALGQQINETILEKFKRDPDFASEYRDLRTDELTDQIVAWADRTYQRAFIPKHEIYPPKQAPFYSISEMQMLPLVDDQIYDLLSPMFTVGSAQGININTMTEPTLRAITLNQITDEEAKIFFEFRDSMDQDNLFRSPEDYFKYMGAKVRAFQGEKTLQTYRQNLYDRNIRLVTDESEFRITITAKFNQATQILIAYVSLTQPPEGGAAAAPVPPTSIPTGPLNSRTRPKVDTGLRVRFMRFL